MSLPDVSDALREWEQPITVNAVTVNRVDGVATETRTPRTVDMVVQVAEAQQLQVEQLDWSKRHIQCHTRADIFMKEIVEFQGEDYIVRSRNPYGQYGYTEVFAEVIK
jgi:hypothetical protein